MMVKDFEKALVDGKMFFMRKYVAFGEWSAPKLVSAEIASRKSRVRVKSDDGVFCPYSFELAE